MATKAATKAELEARILELEAALAEARADHPVPAARPAGEGFLIVKVDERYFDTVKGVAFSRGKATVPTVPDYFLQTRGHLVLPLDEHTVLLGKEADTP